MTDPKKTLPLRPSALPGVSPSPSAGITRRSALQGLASGLGLAVPSTGAAHDGHHPLAPHVAQRPASPASSQPTAAPQFLDAHQLATLTVVCELMVPGSVASGSPAYIDAVLAVEREEVRRSFVQALAAVDAAARDLHGATFRNLPPAQQAALLEAAAASAPASVAPPPPLDAAAPSAPAPRVPVLAQPVTTLKTWIAGAHYSSEAGMQELGFTGTMFFQSFPACPHPEGHQ